MRWLAGALAAALVAATPGPAPDLAVRGTLTRADFQQYREVPVTVPPGVTRITVRLVHDRDDGAVIDLGVWDPERFRGWSGGTRQSFTVSPTDATPGYLRGTLPPGVWKVVLGVPNIGVGVTSTYAVEVSFDRDAAQAGPASDAIADPPLRSGPGWYRGDFHMHDANSDGSCLPRGGEARVPCPLFRTVLAGAAAGLDFIAVSDHNTTAHFDGLRELQPWVAPMLLIPAIEITTFHGHANVIGPRRFVDFRLATQKSIRALQDDAASAGAILSVNHPALPSGALCMGCGWTWPDTDWSRVAAIEAVNGVHAEGVYAGTPFWYARLNQGYRLTGIGGSDNHDPDAPVGQSPVGRPTTVVHARELSVAGIVDGVRAGNVFIDVDGTRNRLLEVEAQRGDDRAAMGGTLPGGDGLRIAAHIVGAKGARATLIVDGQPRRSTPPITNDDAHLMLDAGAVPVRRWIAVTLFERDHPILIGNPVYVTAAAAPSARLGVIRPRR